MPAQFEVAVVGARRGWSAAQTRRFRELVHPAVVSVEQDTISLRLSLRAPTADAARAFARRQATEAATKAGAPLQIIYCSAMTPDP